MGRAWCGGYTGRTENDRTMGPLRVSQEMNQKGVLAIKERDGFVVVSFLEKNCLGEATVAELDAEFGRLACGSALTILLDLSHVEHLDSASFKVIIRLRRVLKKRGGSLILCALPPTLAEVFRITKLDQFFSVKESVEAARVGLLATHSKPIPPCPLCTWPQMGQCAVCGTAFCEEHGSPRRRLCQKHRWLGWIPFIVFVGVLVFLWLMSKG
jgi:anti-anti-sigma factor